MGNSAIAVFKPLYERILSATLQLQRGQGSSAELSSAFQADQAQMLAPIFKEFDADGNGYLDQTELKALVKKSLQAQRQFLPEMMLKMTMAEADRQGAPEEARAMIQKMLKETLGEIQARALDEMVEQSDALVPAITAGLDANGDGKISKQEFLDGYLSQANAALAGVTGGQ